MVQEHVPLERRLQGIAERLEARMPVLAVDMTDPRRPDKRLRHAAMQVQAQQAALAERLLADEDRTLPRQTHSGRRFDRRLLRDQKAQQIDHQIELLVQATDLGIQRAGLVAGRRCPGFIEHGDGGQHAQVVVVVPLAPQPADGCRQRRPGQLQRRLVAWGTDQRRRGMIVGSHRERRPLRQ